MANRLEPWSDGDRLPGRPGSVRAAAAELLAALSRALDVTDGQPPGHSHTGLPERKGGCTIALLSQIALMAQVADVFSTESGPEGARREIADRAGTWLSPELAAAFERAAGDQIFRDVLGSDGLQQAVFALEPARKIRRVDENHLHDIASGFAQVIDSKSPYTSSHSERVTLFTDLNCEQIGLDGDKRRFLKRAALLHDIGRLGVSSTVLDKADKLDEDEWKLMRTHPVYPEAILSNVAVFADLVRVGGAIAA